MKLQLVRQFSSATWLTSKFGLLFLFYCYFLNFVRIENQFNFIDVRFGQYHPGYLRASLVSRFSRGL